MGKRYIKHFGIPCFSDSEKERIQTHTLEALHTIIDNPDEMYDIDSYGVTAGNETEDNSEEWKKVHSAYTIILDYLKNNSVDESEDMNLEDVQKSF